MTVARLTSSRLQRLSLSMEQSSSLRRSRGILRLLLAFPERVAYALRRARSEALGPEQHSAALAPAALRCVPRPA